MFPSSPGGGLISPLTLKEKNIYTHISIFYFWFYYIFKQVITQNLNKFKLGSTLLGMVPSEVAISVASFFGDQSYLISVWLTILFHDWTFKFFKRLEKSSKTIFKRLGFGG